MTVLTLRDWQAAALDRIDECRARGVRSVLGVAATGLGKTILFCAYAERLGERTLILAHRDELIEQAAAKVEATMPGARVGRVKGKLNEVRADVVVASVQTLAREKRLAQLPSARWAGADQGALFSTFGQPFGLVVIDEAHHAAAASYRRIVDHLEAGTETGPFLLGVTATPDRGDKAGLDGVFSEIAFNHDMLWGIRAGYLSDLRGLAVRVDGFDAGKVKVSKGDYDAGQAGAMLESAGAADVVARAWAQHAPGRRTIVFTPTVAFAHGVAAELVGVGARTAVVSGEQPLDERRATLAAFSRGDLDVVVNCAVLTEGYDEPRVDCIVVARPTKSRALYVQMIGRGTRRHPDKTDCLVLDLVGASAEHDMVTVPSLFGLDRDPRARKASAGVEQMVAEYEAEQVRLGRLRAEEVELFRGMRDRGKIAWVPVHHDGEELRRYHRTLPNGPTVVLAQRVAGEDVWTSGLLHRDGTKHVLIANTTLETAQSVAEDYVVKSGAMHVAGAGASWRSRKPTPKQLAAAKRWRITVDPSWSAGDLSDAIDRQAGRSRSRR